MDAGLHPGNIKSKQSRGRQTPWVTPGARPAGGCSCHSVLLHHLLCTRTTDGVKPDKPEVIKVRKRCRRFWERDVLQRSSHSIKACELLASSWAESRGIACVKPHLAPWGRCGKNGLQYNTWTKKKPKKNQKKGRSFLVLARVQLPLLAAACCVVPHLSTFICIQPKELELNQEPGYALVMAQSNYIKIALTGQKSFICSYLCTQQHMKDYLQALQGAFRSNSWK